MALQTARLTTIKTISGYDFSFQPSLDKNRILVLAELGFVQQRQCVHFLGPPGTGKSHLAVALGVEAIKAGKSVYFSTLAELVDSLRKAEREGRVRERVKFLSRYSLLIIDEIGYLPVGSPNLSYQTDAALPRSEKLLIFTVPSGKRATTSNSPPIASMWLRSVDRYISVRFSIFAIEGC